MGYVAVLVAALGGFVMGAIWYMTLSKPWLKAAGIECGEDGKPKGGGSPMPFAVAAVTMLCVAGMMRHMFTMSGIGSPVAGLVSGLGIGLFIVLPWTAMNYAYAMRPVKLTLIDGGYAVTGCAVIGLILGLF